MANPNTANYTAYVAARGGSYIHTIRSGRGALSKLRKRPHMELLCCKVWPGLFFGGAIRNQKF